jgi:K+-transporting ATPase ATPase C chain
MLSTLRPALVLLLLLSVLLGLAYPLGLTGLAQLIAPQAANGSLLERNGVVVGSSLIGQNFTSDKYFHGRPSATMGADPQDSSKTIEAPYNASASTGSNYGPSSKTLVDTIKARAAANGTLPAPADSVTASASGLDPHISPQNAHAQIARVARARGWDEARVDAIVNKAIEQPLFGFIGEPRVNVINLNLSLDDTPN